MDAAFLIVRLIVGLGLAAHGAQKLFGWFGGHGVAGTGGAFEQLGFRPGNVFAFMAGLGEFGGGLLIALGFLGPIGPVLLVAVMVTAIGSVHLGKGFFVTNGGYELNLMYIASAVLLAFSGAGAYSLDRSLGLSILPTARDAAIVLGLGVLAGLLNLVVRRKPSPASAP
jgi:putative oxidoreductase